MKIKNMKIKNLLAIMLFVSTAATAVEYRMVVPFGAGSHGDLTQRIIADRFKEITGDHIVIENKPGAVATSAINYMKANKDVDLIALAAGILVVDPILKEVTYTDADYSPIIFVGTTPFVWISDMLKKVEDMVAQAPAFSGGNAGTGEINLKFLNLAKNLNIEYVSYKAAPEVIIAVAASQIHLANVGLNTTITQMHKTGRINIIGSTYSKDITVDGILIPSVSSKLKVAQLNGFTVIATRSDMDTSKQAKLKAGLWEAVSDPKTRERLKDLFFLDDHSNDTKALNKFILDTRENMKKAVQK
jgi:tripartite-type tricarboxylate transporter receptor subunit TctC